MKEKLTSSDKAVLVAIADDTADACAFTDEEITTAVKILNKIANCQNNEWDIPRKVWEAHTRSKKNVSTELVLLNKRDQIYLVQRQTKKENPDEPYAGQWHFPGTTHGKNEFTEDALKRLIKTELGDISIFNVKMIAVKETKDEERGIYLMRIFVAYTDVTPKNPKGRFFDVKKIPWKKVIKSHRDVILPTAIQHITSKNP